MPLQHTYTRRGCQITKGSEGERDHQQEKRTTKSRKRTRSSAFTAGGNLCTLQDGHQQSHFFLSREEGDSRICVRALADGAHISSSE